MKRLREPLLLVLACALLHAAATLPIPFTWDRFVIDALRVSPDLLVFTALVLGLGATGRPRAAAVLGAFAVLVWTGFRAALVLVPRNLEREFEMTDLERASALWHLVAHDQPTGSVVVMVAWWVVQLAVAFTATLWCCSRISRAGSSPRASLIVLAALQAIVVAAVLRTSGSPGAPSPWHPSVAFAIAQKTWTAVENAIDPEAVDAPLRAAIAEGDDRMRRAPHDLGKLAGADVHVIVLESYGRVAQTRPEIATRLRTVYDELLPRLRAANFAVASAAARPAITGGESWLAHAQLWSSARIAKQRAWQLLTTSDALTLPKVFANAGWRTVEVAPAMDRHWPEGMAFYGFTDEVTRLELGYEGTRYHWGLMPDQFALHHLLTKFVASAREKPLFTAFVSVTNHVPFRLVPPYVDDWRIDRTTFAVPPQVDHGTDFGSIDEPAAIVPAFTSTLEYSLRTVGGFVTRLERPSLVFVLGDHQPPFCGFLEPPERRADVIVHAFSNRPELLAPLTRTGFVDGFEVPADASAFDTCWFAPALLQLYAR